MDRRKSVPVCEILKRIRFAKKGKKICKVFPMYTHDRSCFRGVDIVSKRLIERTPSIDFRDTKIIKEFSLLDCDKDMRPWSGCDNGVRDAMNIVERSFFELPMKGVGKKTKSRRR